MKKIWIILSLMLVMGSAAQSCNENTGNKGIFTHDYYQIYEDVDFYYSIWPLPKEPRESKTDIESYTITLEGLTETGSAKEILVIPEYISGMKVTRLSYQFPGFLRAYGALESEKLKAIYFPKPISVDAKLTFHRTPWLEKIVAVNVDCFTSYVAALPYLEECHIYVPSILYQKKPGYYDDLPYAGNANSTGTVNYEWEFYCANTSYMYNYAGAENEGYYWIDNVDYEAKITYIPIDPKREGYTFGGWYKEPECVNKWDFDTDILPPVEIDEYGSKYKETRLYAKWIVN